MSGLMLTLGLAGIFLAITLMLATVGAITTERQEVSRSLAAVRALEAVPASMRRELELPFMERVLVPALHRSTRLARKLTGAGQIDRIRRHLELAGSPARWDVDRVLAFKLIGLIAGILIGALAAIDLGTSLLVTVGLVIVLTVLGFYLPDIILLEAGQKRQQRIRRDLPDALDLLSITVEAGLAFDAALSQVARNTVGPLADEFFRVLQEMQIGSGRSDALRGLGERTTVPELRGFISAMVQADAFGIPIANVLRVQARDLRIKRSQLAEEQAQKVPVKILFPLVFCIMPTMFIVIIGPAAITIFRNLVHHG